MNIPDTIDTFLDEVLDKYVANYNLEQLGHRQSGQQTIKQAITAKINEIQTESYKKGYIDGGIEILNASCEVCHAYPMTADCNNANCHAIER